MVTRAASRPAGLTQRQVDDFARGGHEQARLLHAQRGSPPQQAEARASAPIAISDKEMEAVRRVGGVGGRIVQRIATAKRPPAPRADRKMQAGRRKAFSAPSLKPPIGDRRGD
jgi:hypothetical protein